MRDFLAMRLVCHRWRDGCSCRALRLTLSCLYGRSDIQCLSEGGTRQEPGSTGIMGQYTGASPVPDVACKAVQQDAVGSTRRTPAVLSRLNVSTVLLTHVPLGPEHSSDGRGCAGGCGEHGPSPAVQDAVRLLAQVGLRWCHMFVKTSCISAQVLDTAGSLKNQKLAELVNQLES